ncbi:MAG: hypothetical protein M3P53_09285 [Actinomycetota bacterium]|nr:hypothetical protein [Actinomycetota bacterium]
MTSAAGSDDKDSVVISNPGGEEPGQQVPRRGRRGGGQARPGHVVTNYHVRGGLDGQFCLYTTTVRREAPITGAEEFDNRSLRGFAAERGMPTCDSGVDAVPARVAQAFVRTIQLPAPRPHIAPDGTNITGLPAYLETNGTLVHQVAPTDTPLGAITVEARGAYWVDWGDGTPEAGPFAFEGEAYPSGRIFHTYRYKGSYTVTVRQDWTATWRLGSDGGTIDGLQTEASISLEVGELQAVIR